MKQAAAQGLYLGDYLIKQGLLTESSLEAMLDESRKTEVNLGQILIAQNALTPAQLEGALS